MDPNQPTVINESLMTSARPEGAGAGAARKRGAQMGGFEGGATAPPRGALGAEPQEKNAILPIKNSFSHGKGGIPEP
jgi:hypothetical protein